jgi:hypothetical protein
MNEPFVAHTITLIRLQQQTPLFTYYLNNGRILLLSFGISSFLVTFGMNTFSSGVPFCLFYFGTLSFLVSSGNPTCLCSSSFFEIPSLLFYSDFSSCLFYSVILPFLGIPPFVFAYNGAQISRLTKFRFFPVYEVIQIF